MNIFLIIRERSDLISYHTLLSIWKNYQFSNSSNALEALKFSIVHFSDNPISGELLLAVDLVHNYHPIKTELEFQWL